MTTDVVGLYPSISHEVESNALRVALDKREHKSINAEGLKKMAESVLKNNLFEFIEKVKQQKPGTTIGTKVAPTYACSFMDRMQIDFLHTQENPPLVCRHYIDDVFFFWTHREEKLTLLLEDLNKYHPDVTFTHDSRKESVNFCSFDFQSARK